MKKVLYASLMLAAVIITAACTKEIGNEVPTLKGNSLIIDAVAGTLGKPDTKAVGNYGYQVVWEENDQIAVTDGNNRS